MRRGTDAKGRGPGVRITFLINWWNEKPLGPNCNAVEAKMIKELGSVSFFYPPPFISGKNQGPLFPKSCTCSSGLAFGS